MAAFWFTRQQDASEWEVTLNGESVDLTNVVCAVESLGVIASQDFTNWQPGDSLPPEVQRYGKVEITRKRRQEAEG